MVGPMSSLTEQLHEVIVPLDEAEARRAIDAALAHVRLRRPLVYGAELHIGKRLRPVPPRRISVLMAELDGYTVHEVLVDDVGSVVEAIVHPELVPPFIQVEIEEATVLARAHPDLADLARSWGIRPAIFYPPHHDQDQHTPRRRRVGVHFLDCRDPAAIVPLASVVVDLTTRQVESVAHHAAGAPEDR